MTLLAVVAALAIAPAAAYGQGSAGQTYGGAGSTIQTQVEGGADPTGDAHEAGALPFTGLDLGLALGGGLLLLAMGFGISRFVRPGPQRT